MSKQVLLLILALLFSSSNSQTCQKVKCGNIAEKGVCIKVEGDLSTMQKCPKGEECGIKSENPLEQANCQPKTTPKILLYPSLPCQTNDQCLSGICENNKCKGVEKGGECTKVSDCNYSLTCRKLQSSDEKKQCLEPVAENEACEVETDCDINHGCHKGKCTRYFTLDDGQILTSVWKGEGYLSLCQSGYSNENGVCQTLKLKNEETACDDENPCEYSSGTDLVKIPENCLCGYNPEGTQYCKLGSGDQTYVEYITTLKNYFSDNSNCHLDERGGDYCVKNKISQEKEDIQKIRELTNAKVKALYNNRLIKADPCAISIEIPEYYNPIIGSCAKFEYKKDKENCAATSFDEEDQSLKVSISDSCSNSEKCEVLPNPNSKFYRTKDQEFKCIDKKQLLPIRRYPGEECSKDDDCVYPLESAGINADFHKCVKNQCTGASFNETCSRTEQCVVGYFCNRQTGVCQEQKKELEDCNSTEECENSLLCYKGICKNTAFAIKTGEKLDKDLENKDFYCEFGISFDGTCAKIVEVDGKADTFKECSIGEVCKYKVEGSETTVFERECECGYNEKGQGYCPKYHDYDPESWKEYFTVQRKRLNNKCHSLHRFNCDLVKEEIEDYIKSYRNKLERAHLFHESVEKAQAVLSSNRLKVRYIYLFAVLAVALFL